MSGTFGILMVDSSGLETCELVLLVKEKIGSTEDKT